MAETINKQQAEHLLALAKLVRLLNCKRRLTIAEIAERMECTYAGASRRLDLLARRGCNIQGHQPDQPRRRGKVGAPPWSYRLHGNEASRRILAQSIQARKILDAARRAA